METTVKEYPPGIIEDNVACTVFNSTYVDAFPTLESCAKGFGQRSSTTKHGL